MTMLPLTQDITYWTVLDKDGNGDFTWNAGLTIKSRWVKKDGFVRDDQGQKQATSYVVYAETLIPKRSRIYLGNLKGQAEPHADALEVMGTTENPSLTTLIKMVM